MSEESISAVIPVFNGERTVPALMDRLRAALTPLASEWEVLFVDDGSRDASWATIEELAAVHPRVSGIRLMRNYGQHNALLCGIRAARGDLIVTLDDDLQNPPEEIRSLLTQLRKGYDVVYGTPTEEQHGLLRNLASRITKLALRRAMGVETARYVSAFRLFRRDLRDAFADYGSPFVSIDVLLTWATTSFSVVRVQHDARPEGASNYSFRSLVTHALNMLTGFSVFPLQVASVLGFALTFFGVGILVYVLGRVLIEGTPVPGFAFLASAIAIFSGAQLFALGMIGEYLARMHFRLMSRPAFAVRTRTGSRAGERS